MLNRSLINLGGKKLVFQYHYVQVSILLMRLARVAQLSDFISSPDPCSLVLGLCHDHIKRW